MRVFIVFALVSLTALVACSAPKVEAEPYADLKSVYLAVVDAQDQLAAGINAAPDAKKVAVVLKTYTAKMREISPRLTSTQQKYPELQNAETPPPQLTQTVSALTESSGRMMEQLVKVQQYLDDPDVTAAMDDLSAAARESAQQAAP